MTLEIRNEEFKIALSQQEWLCSERFYLSFPHIFLIVAV